MPTPTLYNFIATIPRCSETACLAEVIDIFTSRRCDRLMLVSEQHCPIGVVHLQRIIPRLMISTQWKNRGFQANLALSEIKQAIVDPLITIPAQLSGDQLDTYLQTHLATLKASLLEALAAQRSARSCSSDAPFAAQERKLNISCDLALVDPEGKFLGLVDSVRLLRYLVTSRVMGTEAGYENVEMRELDSLAQVLERLPWPLMLLTNKAEVVMQNPAWWQHFGDFSDPEAIRQEVEAILENSATSVDTGAQKSGERSQGILAATSHPKKSRKLRPAETDSAYASYPEVESLSEEDVLADDNDAEPAFATSKRCQIGTEPGTCTCIFAGQNGQERVWQFAKIPLTSTVTNRVDGEQIWLLLATDVTREQQLASELAAKNADLIHLNRLKDEFLACISHELKTPLTAVLGLSTLLEDQAMGHLNERQARYARLIHQSGRHLMTVVNDILDLTRMETGQLELTLQLVKISTVCNHAIQQVRSSQLETHKTPKFGASANPSNHHFTLSIEPGLDSCIADELRLRQMLVHLLANAFKFTETGGEIGLRVNRWEGWIAFTVWDTGIGIPEHQQHLIFQKFQQLENPLTRRFEGTGLGLVLTRALARLHGGDVSFLSTEGKGSQFTLLLPPSPPCKRAGGAGEDSGSPLGIGGRGAAVGDHSALHLPIPSSPHPQSGRYAPPTSPGRIVLVVEAAPRFIENLTEQLNSLGYRFVIARCGTEALEKARRLQPRVILLNPFLPLLSGWDVLTLLKSDPATSQIAVIVTATRAEREQAFLNRADEFLSLPVQQQVLHQLLTRFCAETQISPLSRDAAQSTQNEPLLTILRLVNSYPSPEETPYGLLQDAEHKQNIGFATNQPTLKGMPVAAPATQERKLNYRVLEADDLEQAELLARIWQPNVVLLDAQIPEPLAYFKQLSQQPSLKNLPIVTLETTTTQAANQVAGLAVFPCLTPIPNRSIHTLLPILELAAGIGLRPNLLVVDIATLQDLLDNSLPSISETIDHHQRDLGRTNLQKNSSLPYPKSEWCQALIQYLHTAGFRGVMGRSWVEILQQIRQQSVDLLLIYLSEFAPHSSLLATLKDLSQLHNLPPVLVLDRHLSQSENKQLFHHHLEELATKPNSEVAAPNAVTSQRSAGENSGCCFELAQLDDADLKTVLEVIAAKVLPSSLSMAELLTVIKQSLATRRRQEVNTVIE